ncbi:FtsQ-type POTRA domain-containing protein [Streptococcaceae bacterium ESL0729]|nr:FtsQ-type POTRA domain-containing protein [Streptococcaceae bacterium ESL0729]
MSKNNEENKEQEEHKELSPWQEKHLESEAELREKNRLAEQEALLAESEEDLLVDDAVEKKSNSASDEEGDPAETIMEEDDSVASDEKASTEEKEPIFSVFKKMWAVLLVFLLVFGTSAYFVSPYSKIGKFQIKGEASESVESLAEASGLRLNDKIIHIYLNRGRIERAITKSFPRVESTKLSLAFPNKVLIAVKEYPEIAYIKHGEDYYPVLSDGIYLTDAKITEDKTDKKLPLLVEMTDKSEVEQFIKAYTSLNEEISSQIARVEKTPSKATSDLLTLDLRDGNRIIVPLSEMTLKLPYYTSIKESLTEASDIDMEAGIFSYAKGNPPAKEDASDKKATEDKNQENQAADGSNEAADTQNTATSGQ